MEERVNKTFLTHRKKHLVSRTFIFTFLVLNLTHPLGYAIAKENLIYQSNIDLPKTSGNNKNDLTQDKIHRTMISNEAIVTSINTADNDNSKDSLSSTLISANNTQRLRRDLQDDDTNDDNNSITKNNFSYSSEETSIENLRINCTKNLNCGSCIRNPLCAWCAETNWDDEYYNDDFDISNTNAKAMRRKPRCDLKNSFSNDEYELGFCANLENPKSIITITKNKRLTLQETVEAGEEIVQIAPQEINMRLRIGETSKIRFQVANAKTYPVDLYYLMDLSNSMSDDRDTIVKVSKEIVRTIESITSDFQIGFGSFVDKEVMPYISLVPGKNCQQKQCQKPYSFQHQMSLSSNAELFKERVRKAPISGNIDNPEGGFDALMQVMVCDDQIGWRKNVRRVVIFTTDQSFHIAMDGKLGGLVTPNDGKCHLDRRGFYNYSTVQDYPSIGHINYVALEKKVSVIWAVTKEKYGLYRNLAHSVDGSLVGIVTSDSSNIVDLIRQQYQKITRNVRVRSRSEGSHCSTSITSRNCGKGWNDNKRESKLEGMCREVQLGTSVEFEMEVTLKDCKKDRVIVSPVGLADEMVINIEPICECGCEKGQMDDTSYAYNDPLCDNKGKLVCGACLCLDGFFGPNCKCSNGSLINPLDPSMNCKRPYTVTKSDNTTVVRYEKDVCSNRGFCDACGKCICDKPQPGVTFFGEFCEDVCNNNDCERDEDGRLCSGCGICECGKCKCDNCKGCGIDPGPDCKCSLCKCRKTPNDKICSGIGHCECDKCVCPPPYTGKFCEKCETCRDKCEVLRACVEFVYFGDNSRLLEEVDNEDVVYRKELEKWSHPNITEKDLANIRRKLPNFPCLFRNSTINSTEFYDKYSNDSSWTTCGGFKYHDCKYKFSFTHFGISPDGPDEVKLHLFEDPSGDIVDRICPLGPDLLGWAFGVIAMIVAVGLVTILLWKAFTTIHDRKEFARFEQERQKMKFSSHSNPIFKQATTTIQNPLFNKPE